MKEIIVYRITDTGITNNITDIITSNRTALLDFLLVNSKDSIKLFVNLDNDVAKLLKLLNLSTTQLEDLVDVKQCVVDKFYKLMYIPGKWFSIDKYQDNKKQWSGFSDLQQYSILDDMTNLQLAHGIATEVYTSLLELGFNPTSLISPANIYRKEVLNNLDLPTDDDIPEEAGQIAYECCKGNWVEAYAIGKFNNVYDYDINSAYPAEAAKLIDLRLGTWKQSTEYQKDATYGYCRCEVCIETDFSPIIMQFEDRNYTPKGIFETSLTKAEIDFIDKWHLGYVTILNGWWWFADFTDNSDSLKNATYHPFVSEVTKLYQQKQQATGLKKEIIKRIMSGSFYGVFLQIQDNDKHSLLLTPYAAEIEANTRLKIADLVLSNKEQDNILHVTVDGVTSKNPLYYPGWQNNEEIGQVRQSHYGNVIICSSGLICIDSKQGHGDFSVSYQQLLEIAEDNPDKSEYTFKKDTILTLAQAANLNRIHDVGTTETITRTIDFGDTKRLYQELPNTFKDLINNQYYSEAFDMSILTILESGQNDYGSE